MTVAEALERILPGWDEAHWYKGALSNDDDTAVCLMGRVAHVTTTAGAEVLTSNFLADMANELWPDRFVTCPGKHQTAQVNDHPDTTWDDIRVWVEKAIPKAQEIGI